MIDLTPDGIAKLTGAVRCRARKCAMALHVPKALTPDEFARGAHTELIQIAGMLDRMLAQCHDRDLAKKLTPIRGHVGAAVDELGERCGMVQHTPEQQRHYARFPWDRP